MVLKPRSGPVSFLWELGELYFSKRISRWAAALAYFMILSFFPALICINAVIGTLHLDVVELVEQMSLLIPQSALSLLDEYIQYISGNRSRGLIIGGVIMLLFTSSAAMRVLMNAMDEIHERTTYSGFWSIVASVAFSVVFLLTVYLSLAVVLTGNWFFHLLEGLLLEITGRDFIPLPWSWQWMRFLVLFCLVLVFVLILYRATAPRGKPRHPVMIGALVAAVSLVAASSIFSAIISLSSRYSLVYGSLASVIVLLVWLYLCGTIVIMGSCVNRVWYGRYRRRPEKKIRKEEIDHG